MTDLRRCKERRNETLRQPRLSEELDLQPTNSTRTSQLLRRPPLLHPRRMRTQPLIFSAARTLMSASNCIIFARPRLGFRCFPYCITPRSPDVNTLVLLQSLVAPY